MTRDRLIANISGYNGDEVDPCPSCGTVGGCVHTDDGEPGMGDSCCEALAEQVANLTAQVEALAEAVVNLANSSPQTVVVRQVCLADGSASLAYDLIPGHTAIGAPVNIQTIYRPYPAEEGPCDC